MGTTNESVVPVVATVPSSRHTARNERLKKRRHQGSTVAQALGMIGERDESDDDRNIFPDEKEEGEPVTANEIDKEPVMREEKDDAANPYEQADEHGLPPSVALVAPDVTPKALIPLDASKIPNFKETKFTTTQADMAAPQQEPEGGDAVDAILGRSTTPEVPDLGPAAPRTVSTEEANAMMGVRPPSLYEDAGGDGLGGLKAGSEMPAHKDGDVKKIMNTFRRFNR